MMPVVFFGGGDSKKRTFLCDIIIERPLSVFSVLFLFAFQIVNVRWSICQQKMTSIFES